MPLFESDAVSAATLDLADWVVLSVDDEDDGVDTECRLTVHEALGLERDGAVGAVGTVDDRCCRVPIRWNTDWSDWN